MFKKILIAFLVAIVLLLATAATKPDTFEVQRSVTIAAAPGVVFAHISDFRAWAAWSPWEKLDPQMKKTFEGPATGLGSHYAWSGNSDVGQGAMTITGIEPDKSVTIKLEFKDPFEATNTTTFDLNAVPQGTTVTWSMAGENNMMGKVISIFADMDAMIGKDFEKGLAELKTVSETSAEDAKAAEAIAKPKEEADAAEAQAAPAQAVAAE